MTISQALRRISKLKGQLREHLARAEAAVTHREDAPPAFPFGASLEAADAVAEELIRLEAALRVTNAQTTLQTNLPERVRGPSFAGTSTERLVGLIERMTLAEATCRLQEIKGRIAWLKGLPVRAQAETREQAGHAYDAARNVVIVYATVTCALPEARRADAVERAQAAFDVLNDAVEAANHRTELIKI